MCDRLFTRSRLLSLVVGLTLLGCNGNSTPLPPPTDLGDDEPSSYPDLVEPEFLDTVQSNLEDDGTLGQLEFVNTQGDRISIADYQGMRNILLVFTRGFSGVLCPYCTTQTSRLIANYDEFTKRDTEVLLVYPGSKEQLPMFQLASIESSGSDSFPFPVLLDEDLTAVKRLGIAAQLAYPSTFIIDKQGEVRLSYVGSTPSDRPSIKAILGQLDALSGN